MRNHRFVLLSSVLMALACSLPVTGCTAVADFPDYPLVVESVALGEDFMCVRSKENQVLCWGNNEAGQLGTEGVGFSDHPLLMNQLDPVQGLAAGRFHVCALDDQQSVWCWGSNDVAQIGVVGGVDSNQIREVSGISNVAQLYLGLENSCARDFNFNFYCWGSNRFLQLTEPLSTTHSAVPVPIPVPNEVNIESLAVGERHMCALDGAKDVYCWGDNSFGQTGLDGNSGDEVPCGSGSLCIQTPRKVESLSSVKQISSRTNHTCALMEDGSIQCWGENYDGQVGIDSGSESVPEPAAFVKASGVSGWTQVSTGYNHSCAIAEGGGLYCWGNNFWGQLAVSYEEVEESVVPLRVAGLDDVRDAVLGCGTTCALVGDEGTLYCWGDSGNGLFGEDGSNYDTPVRM